MNQNQTATTQQEKAKYQKAIIRDVAMAMNVAGGALGYMILSEIHHGNWLKAAIALVMMIPTAFWAVKYDRASR